MSTLVAGELHDRTLWCEAAAQHGETARLLDWVVDWANHILPSALVRLRGDLAHRSSINALLVQVQQATSGKLAQHQGDATSLVQIECGVRPTWDQVADDGR